GRARVRRPHRQLRWRSDARADVHARRPGEVHSDQARGLAAPPGRLHSRRGVRGGRHRDLGRLFLDLPAAVRRPEKRETRRVARLATHRQARSRWARREGVMAGLIDLTVAKTHLRITDALHDADVQLKLDQAEAAIPDHLKPARKGEVRTDWPWTTATLPPPVQAAMLVLLRYLYDAERGDEPSAEDPEHVWSVISGLVIRYRDQAIARPPPSGSFGISSPSSSRGRPHPIPTAAGARRGSR